MKKIRNYVETNKKTWEILKYLLVEYWIVVLESNSIALFTISDEDIQEDMLENSQLCLAFLWPPPLPLSSHVS